MKRLALITAAVIAAAGCGTAAMAGTRPPAGPSRCVTLVISGQPAVGMPFNEPVTFCGKGLPSGTWQCPAKSPALLPGTRLSCTRE